MKNIHSQNARHKKYLPYRSDIWGKLAKKHRNNFRIVFFRNNVNKLCVNQKIGIKYNTSYFPIIILTNPRYNYNNFIFKRSMFSRTIPILIETKKQMSCHVLSRSMSYLVVDWPKDSRHHDPKGHPSVIKKQKYDDGEPMPANRLTHAKPQDTPLKNDKTVMAILPVSEKSMDGTISPKGPQNIAVVDANYTEEDYKKAKINSKCAPQGEDDNIVNSLNNVFGYTKEQDDAYKEYLSNLKKENKK